MLKFRKSLVTTAMLAGLPLSAFALNNSFTINNIQLAGLQRVQPSAVMHYIPVHKGDVLTDQKSNTVIDDLYKTGFFSNIQLKRQGNTLWVMLTERPTISDITFSGNSAVSNKQLLKALNSSGITEGAFYDSSKLHNIVEGLKQLYASSGHSDALINVKVAHANQNRIGLNIKINEGGVAKVSAIKFVDAKDFSTRELKRQLKMHPTNILEFLSGANKFSQTGLEANNDALTNFYLDHGYLDFKVQGYHVAMSDDKKHVAIIYYLNEGQQYTVSDIDIINHSKMATAKIRSLLKLHAGDIFSRAKIIDTNTAVGNAFADIGYAFPNISMQPDVDTLNHTVSIKLIVEPGKHVTVRYINFSGNNMTEDQTLRHELTIAEGSPYAQSRLAESRRRFYNLPFITKVDETTTPVPGKANQVDLNYKVAEMEAGRAQIMGGYSDTEGWLYGVSLSEPNFKGEGKSVNINLTRSQLSNSLSFSYNNPFYTVHNIGRGYELHYTKTNPSSTLNMSSYDLDGFGGSLNYTIPMSNYLTFTAGVGYDQQQVKSTKYTPASIRYFIDPKKVSGDAYISSPKYNLAKLNAGLSYVDTDRYYFPTSGTNTSFSVSGTAPVFTHNLQYYQADLSASWYHPLSKSRNWVLILHTQDDYGRGYGNTKYFPFMNNFYGGGISTVPGFSSNTLGPHDKYGNALGGNEAVAFGFDVVFPNPIGNSVRTSLTVNGGNIYNQMINKGNASTLNPNDKTNRNAVSSSGPMRYSVGLRVQWQMPILGTISFAVAKAINPQTIDGQKDQTSWFNFNFGRTF